MTTETDPVCGMTVDVQKSTAPSTLEGRTYHFCGTGCREKWDVNPQKYARKTAARESRRASIARATRLGAAVIAVVGLATANDHAIAPLVDKGRNFEAQTSDSRWKGKKQHKDYSGKALLGDNIKKNGAHRIQVHGRYSASVNVSGGRITGMKVKHADRGSVPVTKYKTTTAMAQGKTSGPQSASQLFSRSQNIGTMWSGYGYIDDWGDEHFYWFPYAMIDNGNTGAIEYYPAY